VQPLELPVRAALAGLRVESFTVCPEPIGRIDRFGPSPKGHLPHTAPLIAKKRPHHSIRQVSMIVEPGRQVIDEFESRRGISLFDSQDKLAHPLAGSIMLLFMPTQ